MTNFFSWSISKNVVFLTFLTYLAKFGTLGKAQFPFGYYGPVGPYPAAPPTRHYPTYPFVRQSPSLLNPLIQQSSTGFHQQQVFLVPDALRGSPAGIRKNLHFGFQSPFGLGGGVPFRIANVVQVPFNPFHPFFAATVIPDGFQLDDQEKPELEAQLSTQEVTSLRSGSCSYFSQQGVCYSSGDCRQRGGTLGTYCRDVTKFCCIFKWKCSSNSKEEKGYFVNQRYPLSSTLSDSCTHTVTKMDSNICVIRITPKRLTLPANIGFCDDLHFSVSGVPGSSFEPLCGHLNDKTYDVDVSSTSSVTFKMSTNQPIKLTWNILIEQVPCSEASGSTWPFKGTQQSPTEKPEVEAGPPGTSVNEPPLPATSQVQGNICGLANTRSEQLRRGEANVKSRGFVGLQEFLNNNFGFGLSPPSPDYQLSDDEEEEEEEANNGEGAEEDDGCPDDAFRSQCLANRSEDLLLQSLDWDVPSVNESLLFEHAGYPSLAGGRITYGQKTQPHEFPWTIAMYNNGRFHCGASLLSNKHVLTAAHCVIKYKRNPARLKLSIGDWNINTKSDGPNVNAKISKIVTHPGYSTLTLKYDLAVLTLKDSVRFSDKVRPICLPQNDATIDGQKITVIGWGRDEKNRLQPVLMKHSAAVVSNRFCNDRWENKGAPSGIIADTMLCMDPQDGDSCKGDSGGPAIKEDPPNSNRYVQVGIVSFGSASCTDKALPGVYTKVSKVTDWIKSQMV